MQKVRQLDRYSRRRPIESDEYKEGKKAAILSVSEGVAVECPHHSDSGRYLRWTLGYTDELLRITCALWDRTKEPAYRVLYLT